MIFTNCIQSVCLLVISPCFISTYKHQYGSDISFNDMNATSEENTKQTLVTIKDGSNTYGDGATHSTTQSSTYDAGGNSSDTEHEKDEVERKNCNKDSFEEEKCVDFIQRKLLRDKSIKERIYELLKDLPLCLQNNGSILHIDPRVQICCNGVKNRTANEECCRGHIFDKRKQICCNQTLHVKTDTSACCGPQLYDTNISLCCNGSLPIIPRLLNIECCGNKTFVKSTQVCCHGNVQPAHGLRNKKGDCCNGTSYHEDCHQCEESTTLYALFDESFEICCHGKIIERIHGNNSVCCHRRIMNNDKHICVEKKIVPKPESGIPRVATPHHLLTSGRKTMLRSGQASTGPSHTETDNINMSAIGGVIGCVTFTSIGLVAYIILCRDRTDLARCKQFLRRKKHISYPRESSDKDQENVCVQHDRADRALNNNFAPDENGTVIGENQSLLDGNDCHQSKSENECYTNEIANTENETVYSDGLSFSHEDIALPTLLRNIEKEKMVDETNIITSHFREGYTQTEQVVNRRTIFGQLFEHTFLLDEAGSDLSIPGSDVSLRLPKSVFKSGKVEVNCSSFSSLSDLRKKLGLADEKVLASPVVEFAVTGYSVLSEHARVVVPFVGNPSDLIVKKFKSDEGLNTVATSVEIAEKHKQNEDLDTFYVVEDSSVVVYAKSFSGFYCTRCRHRRDVDLTLRSFTFGSYKRINKRFEVGISVYIADEIFKFKDYQKRMSDNEGRQEKEQLKDIQLIMPEYDLKDTDFIEACITPQNEGDDWIHRPHPRTKKPIQEGRKEISLGYIAQKCKKCPSFNPHELEIPYCTEWYLTTPSDTVVPSEVFQCTIDLNICKRETELKKETSIFIEELLLRSKDRLPIKEDYIRAMAQADPIQETCNAGVSEIPRHPIESTNRLAHCELSRLPVTSYSEADSTGLSTERPSPELSASAATTDYYPALPPVSTNMVFGQN